MMRKCLALCLACGLLFAPLSLSSEPSRSSSGVWLSTSEYDQIEKAMTEAADQLTKSNEEMTRLSKDYKKLSLFCVLLGGALALNGIGLVIVSLK